MKNGDKRKMEVDKTNKLKQEIEEYLTRDYCCEFKQECKDGVRNRCSDYEAKLYLILRFAESREKKIAELEKQIEKMKKERSAEVKQRAINEIVNAIVERR